MMSKKECLKGQDGRERTDASCFIEDKYQQIRFIENILHGNGNRFSVELHE